MAYGFIQRCAKKDNDVKDYLDEGMLFEAWIMVMRNGVVSADKFFEELEKESELKHPNLTNDELISIDCEYFLDSTAHHNNPDADRVWKEEV